MKQKMSKRISSKKMVTFLFAVMMLVGALAVPASAATTEDATTRAKPPNYVYVGYTCRYYDCGLGWQNEQRYNQYANSAGDLYTEYAGFGVCCP